MAGRDTRGRFCRQEKTESFDDTDSDSLSGAETETPREEECGESVVIDHNYVGAHLCPGLTTADSCQTCGGVESLAGKKVKPDSWKTGRRVIELEVLLGNLSQCKQCHLGPIPLMYSNIIGEMQCGLGGYLHIQCQNPQCLSVNKVAYGKLHSKPGSKKQSCFVVNTKLGTGE